MAQNSERETPKIQDMNSLAEALNGVRASGEKIVHCHGVFDLVHIGHIRHLEQAKKLGDVLVVTLTQDQHVNKGPSRPVFTESLRAEALAALDCVDFVAINKWPTAVECIELLRPDVYVKGSDYREAMQDRTGGITREEAAVKSVGGRLDFTDDIVFSSSNLINQYLPNFPSEVTDYLSVFSNRHSSDEVLRYLDDARSLKVLVVGEVIIDEYVYCETLGKSGKEPVLASKHLYTERFGGGIIAVANHVAAFSDQVTVLTFLGQVDTQEDFVREKLDPNVNPVFLYMNGNSPTIVKRRFVESYPLQKLFELYIMDDNGHKPAEVAALSASLQELIPEYDVVIVLDYGHGMLGPEAIDILSSQAKFLAINTQANAGNRGFNTVSKYPHADFMCVSENELRLEARNRRDKLEDIILEASARLSCDNAIITRGQNGCICYNKDEGFVQVPALAVQVVDRVGAGDAFFSVAALCVAQQAPMEIVGLIGNAVAAEAVATVAHRNTSKRVPLYRHIETLLK